MRLARHSSLFAVLLALALGYGCGIRSALFVGDAGVDSSVDQTGVERIALPEHAATLGRAAADHLGLAWTGMDLVRAAESGEYFILECNASAMFADFSAVTGCDVAGALAELLVQLARS
jgi:hypothetical protein